MSTPQPFFNNFIFITIFFRSKNHLIFFYRFVQNFKVKKSMFKIYTPDNQYIMSLIIKKQVLYLHILHCYFFCYNHKQFITYYNHEKNYQSSKILICAKNTSSSPNHPLVIVFYLDKIKKTITLKNMVLKLFIIYKLCKVRVKE